MWFRNLQLYRFTKPFELSAEALEQKLARDTARPCGSLEMSTLGWVPPLGRHGQLLVHEANGRIMICLRKEEKVLPSAVIREELEARSEAFEAEQGRPLRRRERTDLRENIVQELLPKAFTRANLTFAYLDPAQHWLVVDAASPKRAEDLLSLLRRSIESLPVVPPATQLSPVTVMTRWLEQGQATGAFMLEDECELREPGEEGGIVRVRRQDLAGDEIRAHLNAGKQAVKLALNWNERLHCVITDELGIRRLRFLDVVEDEAAQADVDDYASRFDADFALMALELSHFIPQLLEAFGGLAEEQTL